MKLNSLKILSLYGLVNTENGWEEKEGVTERVIITSGNLILDFKDGHLHGIDKCGEDIPEHGIPSTVLLKCLNVLEKLSEISKLHIEHIDESLQELYDDVVEFIEVSRYEEE